MTLFYQLITTAILCYVCTTLGILFALPSSTITLFSTENTTLDRIMTETELSLLGSISSGSALLITPFCGYMMDTFGRKRTLILLYLPQLFSCVLLVTINTVETYIFAMFLSGISASIFLVVPVYVNEYCDPSIRGGLSSSGFIFNIIGMLVSYLLGGLLEYKTMNYTNLTLNVIGLVLINFVKESPLYLMKKGLEEEATQSFAFYAGAKINSKEVIMQMKNIKQLLNADVEISGIPDEESLKPIEEKCKITLSMWTYLNKLAQNDVMNMMDLRQDVLSKEYRNTHFHNTNFKISTIGLASINKNIIDEIDERNRSTRRALICVLILYTLCVFQGVIAIQVFAVPLFEAALPNMSATLSSIMFAIISISAGFIGAYIIDKVGRRILLIVASIATGICCFILGTLIHFKWASGWWSAIFIYLYSTFNTLGAGAVPFVLMGEVFLPEVKGFATTVCMEWFFVCNFIILFMFNPLFNAYGLSPLFHFFGGISFLTAFYSFIYLPETKNLPVDIIQQKFLKRIKF